MISVIISLILLLCMLPRLFFFFAKLDMLITTLGIIRHVGYHIWDRNCYHYKKKTSVFIEKTRDNIYIIFLFLNVNHARNDLKFYKLRASFRPKLFSL